MLKCCWNINYAILALPIVGNIIARTFNEVVLITSSWDLSLRVDCVPSVCVRACMSMSVYVCGCISVCVCVRTCECMFLVYCFFDVLFKLPHLCSSCYSDVGVWCKQCFHPAIQFHMSTITSCHRRLRQLLLRLPKYTNKAVCPMLGSLF